MGVKVISTHVILGSGEPLCRLPKITRHWKRLGDGATWTCSCGQVRRLVRATELGGPKVSWQWESVSRGGGER